MGWTFWIRRFLFVFAVAGCIIAAAQLVQGREVERALREGLAWGGLAAAVFTLSRIHQSRRGVHCAVCRDTPEMQAERRDPG